MRGFEGESHPMFLCQRSERFQRLVHQATGMAEGVAPAASCVHQQRIRAEVGGLKDRFAGVDEALVKGASVAASEAARPLQT